MATICAKKKVVLHKELCLVGKCGLCDDGRWLANPKPIFFFLNMKIYLDFLYIEMKPLAVPTITRFSCSVGTCATQEATLRNSQLCFAADESEM